MPTHINKTNSGPFSDDIKFINSSDNGGDFARNIAHQTQQTYISHTNILQELQKGIYLLTVRKNDIENPLQLKKLSDKAQYAILPAKHNNEPFGKISLNSLKNQCHGLLSSPWAKYLHGKGSPLTCQLYFYFHLPYVERTLVQKLEPTHFNVREILSNRTVLMSDGEYNYPVSIAKLPSVAIWNNETLLQAIDQQMDVLVTKFTLLRELNSSIKNAFRSSEWTLHDGQMRYTQGGLTRSFDYASLLDDICFAGYQNRIEQYLAHFRASDLDSSSSFPTVSVRSLVHLKARPQSLSNLQNGYAICAAKENLGKQTPIDAKDKNSSKAFSLWLNRAQRHVIRHNYHARVIFASETAKGAFSLVGEQIASIALFPGLVKGVFESLNIEAPPSVRMIAHNEDVITIAHDTASWADINLVNQKAASLFKLISNDGADPLSLFEQIRLPDIGVGTFQLRMVPDSFFELIETAHTMKHSMPPGHDHYLLGLAFECLHEWGLAVAEFQKALRFDSNDADILHALGSALMEIEQIKEALPFLKRAFDLLPEDPEVANNCGLSSIECGQLEDAIKAFERAVRLSPGSADYLKNLGDGYLLAARPLDALATLNKAIRCNPHSAQAHASLAHLHLAGGDEDLAKKHALIAYRENPVDANIANLLWHLTLGKK